MRLYCLIFAFLLLPTCYGILGIGKLQHIAVSGYLSCNGKRRNNIRVKLFEREATINTKLDEGRTNLKGYFELRGSKKEMTKIDPQLVVYTRCNYIGPCMRKLMFDIPKTYVRKGKESEKIYNLGTINLEKTAKREVIEFSNPAISDEYDDFLVSNQLVYEHIFTGYVKDIPPVSTKYNDSTSAREFLQANGKISDMTVKFELIDGSFLQLDQMSQTVYMQLEFNVEWMDLRLVWEPSNFSDIAYMYVRRSQVWLPDFTIRNSEKTEESLPEETQYVYITYYGLVTSFWNLLVRQPCALKLEKFPFDTQKCTFSIYSNSAGLQEIFVENKILEKIDLTTWGNGEWNVLNVSVRDYVGYEGDLENEMQIGEYSIVIKRTTAYYVAIILIPCFLCTIIIIIGLFMATPGELIGKLTVGLTGMMALVFLMGLAANSLPHTSTVPSMMIYILTCLSLIVSSVLYVLVFPSDPFTKNLISWNPFNTEIHSTSKVERTVLWRLFSVHNILCICLVTTAFVHLVVLVNTD
ncbi:hypothetical protein Q1695_004769 [Nippostrongylus brasiliensis]|nr:hypothetical protein Q1695_004769 [Nippostrongylus brasiliensis]